MLEARLRRANDRPVQPAGEYVLYWPQMFRRLRANHALDHAIRLCRELHKPLVIYEGLKLDYPWANARFHQFLLEGMAETAQHAAKLGLNYWPFVETPEHSGRGLVRRLAQRACVVVTDDFPQFIVPAQIHQVARQVDVAVHAVDGNSIVPLSLLGPPTAAAAHLRPKWHKLFADAWKARAATEPDFPKSPKLEAPFSTWQVPNNLRDFVKSLPIDQTVPAVPGVTGGTTAAQAILQQFVTRKLPKYADERNKPDDPAKNSASALSFHLHYGHISIQEVCEAVLGPEWTINELNLKTRNKDDFFCTDPNVNSYLDEAITWRDVGYQWHFARQRELRPQPRISWQTGTMPSFNFRAFDYSDLPSTGTLAEVLPSWAVATLNKHAADKRDYCYELEQLENAATHDPLWNAAQTELVATGRIHNYLRMLWGKKVLEWSATPEQGYRILEHLNNKYALDGRDPNSYTGILWCFGLFDRPWPPERPIFGSVRYMTSDSTARKFKLAGYYEYIKKLPRVTQVHAGQLTPTRPATLF